MKNRKSISGILLDTSFILPTLGMDVGKTVEEALEKINSSCIEIYFSTFSILEALWIAIRFIKESKFDDQSFMNGLKAIMRFGKYIRIRENDKVFYGAIELYKMGHKDIIDNILYMDSLSFNLKLLTLDIELRNFIRLNGLKDTLLFPRELEL